MADSSVPITAGSGTNIDTYQLSGGDHRQVVMVAGDHGAYRGRAVSNVIPGRAATTHNLAAIHNASGSAVKVDVQFVGIDLYQTVIKAVTTPPPLVRVSRFTTLPTGGTPVNKGTEDTSFSSSSSVTIWNDASADRTSSSTALNIAPGIGITQEFAPRMITAAGYEMADRMEFLQNGVITLRALEGLVVHTVNPSGTSEPITDMYCVTFKWEEYA